MKKKRKELQNMKIALGLKNVFLEVETREKLKGKTIGEMKFFRGTFRKTYNTIDLPMNFFLEISPSSEMETTREFRLSMSV